MDNARLTALYNVTLAAVTTSRENYAAFLDTAARNHKYPFAAQILIHAQRPDATACATAKTWGRHMGRGIRDGAAGITLTDSAVYDVSDTVERGNARSPFDWSLTDEEKLHAITAFDAIFGVVEKYPLDNANKLCQHISKATIRRAVSDAVSYILARRFGLDAREPQVSFSVTELTVKHGVFGEFGELVSTIAKEISVGVQTAAEQRRGIERNGENGLQLRPTLVGNLGDGQGREHGTSGADGRGRDKGEPRPEQRPLREVRESAQDIPQGESAGAVGGNAQRGEALRSTGFRQHSAGRGKVTGQRDERLAVAEPAAASGDAGVDAAHEQFTAHGGGSGSERYSLRLDTFLRMGGNQKDSKLRIAAEYQKNKPDNTEFLIREYKRGGRGLTIDGQPFSMWFDTDGITIGSGRRAVGVNGGDFYTWSEVDKRIRALLDEGSYLPQTELNKAWNFVRHELAERIWCFYRDNHDIGMPAKWKMGKHSVFDDVNLVELDLYDFTRIAVVADNLETDMETAEKVTNSSLPDEIRELAVNPIFFTEKEMPAEPPQFITDDEIDAFFIGNSHMQDGKYTILSALLRHSDINQQAKAVQDNYGNGGSTGALSGAEDSYYSGFGKNLQFSRGSISNPYAKVELSWNEAAKRINRLIAEGRYLTRKEIDSIPNFERYCVANSIISFYRSMPSVVARPTKEEISDGLLNPKWTAEIVDSMSGDISYLPKDDRNREFCEKAIKTVTEYHAGTFDLFPNFDRDTGLVTEPVEESPQISMFGVMAEPKPVRATKPTARKSDNIKSVVGYTEPFVVIEHSESTRFSDNERLTFAEADAKFKAVEKTERAERAEQGRTGGYHKTWGKVYYLDDPADTELSAYEFRYDIGDYDEEHSGLYNHIHSFWDYAERQLDSGESSYITREEIDESRKFIAIFEKYKALPMQETPDEKMYREYTQIKEQHPDCLLLYQVGGFYELLGDDAKIVADFFDFKLLTRGDVPMCGIPAHVIADYSEKLYDAGYGIAFADEDNGARVVSTTPPKSNKPEMPKPGNFKITDNHLGEGGTKAKYAANIAAIKTLQAIEAERRSATPDEQELLSRYVGWGGISQAFDSDNASWSAEYAELKALLSLDEYESARASTLNAHYTSPVVIRAIYDTVERMGFTSGNILEPAMGVGNFFGLIPDSMRQSKLYGVELDGITGRIAKQLYPHANITISGFEKTKTPDSFFDLAVGNVPFGDYGVADKRYDKNHFHIHDYFFAKALDQVRPGGIIAFITSKGTMDKKNSAVRKYIAQRAELLGAVRLPNNAFLKNAGTGVTSDIIFLQKRDRPIDVEPDWVHLSLTDDGIPVNSYFAEHPEMILGTMTTEHTQYGHDTTCTPIDGAVLSEQLTAALANVYGEIKTADVEYADEIDERGDIPANPDVKNYSYTVVDNCVYYRENSRMYPIRQPAATLDRIRGMVELRDCTRKLIDLQLLDHSDEEIRDEQLHLGKLYDSYTRRFGLLNDSANKRAFSDDSAYYLLCSLEILDENGKLKSKADMFDKRTIGSRKPVTHVDTAAEALAVSIGERACVDLGFMAQLMGGGDKIEQVVADLHGVIFKDPANGVFQTADEYLSGNVREKLRIAREAAGKDPLFEGNVTALEAAQPPDLDASEIFVSLGATWIDKKYIQQFMYETFQTPYNSQSHTKVNYSAHSGVWNISEKRYNSANDIASTFTYGTKRMNAYQILEETLNLHDVRIFDTVRDAEGKEKRVLNNKETTIARQKQEGIKQAFRDWIFSDPKRRHDLVELYNKNFNSTRPREYDGSHIMFSDMSPEIKLEKHQVDAIARVLYGGNTLLAHEVGAGKTFEMTAAAMESKRLGLCRKSMIAVPNHLTEQWASEFMRLYPAASILVTTKKDFEPANRKKFCARIATGDYDAVIIGHSQFEKIPLSSERQERYLRDKISEIKQALRESDNAERYTVKELEKMLKSYKAKLERLAEGKTRDDVVTFEELGVDRLFVDEAHNFKNLETYTKIRNVTGLSAVGSQKAEDLHMKTRYMDELTHGKGTIFATGTPISNTMVELYTMQRYLQHSALEENNLTHFDSWASIFCETVTSVELAPEGTGYRARTRFARFNNLPELMSLFKDVADIQTADMLNLPRPTARFHTIVAQPSEIQREMVKELSKRAAAVHAHKVKPWEDNMLAITTDGRKIGLDQRLANPMLPDDPTSKVNLCVENVLRIWRDTEKKKLTQLLFCDFSTPNDDKFNVYDDIKGKLLANGVPEHEIAYIHTADNEEKKKKLFAAVKNGQVRILMGSTAKLGAGTDVQNKLIALHDLDCPWRPADLIQRSGRILRRGNENPEVDIYRYCTEGTFDAYLFQTLEKKQRFISQVMTSKTPARSCEDVDEAALNYAEIKALCAGNPMVKEKMDLDIEVARLKLLKADYKNQHYRLEDSLLKDFPLKIRSSEALIAAMQKDLVTLAKTANADFSMEINGVTYTDKVTAGKLIIEACKHIGKDAISIGSYRGLAVSVEFEPLYKDYLAIISGARTYRVSLGEDPLGNITRIDNRLERIPAYIEEEQGGLENLFRQRDNAAEELKKPFEQEAVLAEKSARLVELDALLNMDAAAEESEGNPEEQSEEEIEWE